MQLLTRNAQPPRGLADLQPKRWEDVFPHDLTWMDRRTPQMALNGILFHHPTSMILLQIDPQRLSLFPFEGNAPWAVDVNTVSRGYPLKAMEVEPRDV
jgi:hypothetical protein